MRLLIAVLFIGLYQSSLAQEDPKNKIKLIGLKECVEIALNNNEQIAIAKNNLKIGEQQTQIGNAGLLPRIYLSGGYNLAEKDTQLKFANPQQEPIDVNNAQSSSYNGSVNLQYTLFKGRSNYYKYKQLQTQNALNFWQYIGQVESIISQVMNAYLDATQQKLLYDVQVLALKLSKDRWVKMKTRYAFGGGSKIELYNAEVAYNTDSIEMLDIQNQVRITNNNLKVLIGDTTAYELQIKTTIGIQQDLQLDTLRDLLASNNVDIKMNGLKAENSYLQQKVTMGKYMPSLNLNGAYGYNHSRQGGSFIESQNTLGLSGGLSLTFDLYNGGSRKRDRLITNKTIENVTLAASFSEKQLDNRLTQLFNSYKTGLIRLELQQLNQKTASLAYERSMEAFGNGQITGTQLRESQLNLVQSGVLLSNTLIDSKRSEIALYLLTGQLFERK